MVRELVYGVGVDDLDYPKKKLLPNGKYSFCPYYQRWRGMIRRCYSKAQLGKNPNYEGCTVCDEWLTFSNFKSWMEKQDWEGKELDKDLLVRGNRVYSPHTCLLVSKTVNSFLAGFVNYSYATGTCLDKKTGLWRAQCSNPFASSGYLGRGYIGLFKTQEQAHLAWKAKKHEYACMLADIDDNIIVSESLRNWLK